MTCKEDDLGSLVINRYSKAFKNVDREAVVRTLSFYQNLFSFIVAQRATGTGASS